MKTPSHTPPSIVTEAATFFEMPFGNAIRVRLQLLDNFVNDERKMQREMPFGSGDMNTKEKRGFERCRP